MLKRIITLVMIFCLAINVGAYASVGDSISATIVGYEIISNGGRINEVLENPIINYNNHTYIAVRDMAKALNKEIRWDEEYNESSGIVLYDAKKDKDKGAG